MNAYADPHRHIAIASAERRDVLARREWFVANGLGGYASGTLGGVPTRRYHGMLVAALPNPAGRVMMLNSVAEQVKLPDHTRADLGWVAPVYSSGNTLELVDFELELGLPVWRFSGLGVTIERRVFLAYGHNTTFITYRLLEGPTVKLEVRPSLQFRGHDDPVSVVLPEAYPLHAYGARIDLSAPAPLPGLRLHLHAAKPTFVIQPMNVPDLAYETEESRGYESRGQLYSPGRFRAHLAADQTVALVASTEPWETVRTMSPDDALAAERERRHRLLDQAHPKARTGVAAELVLAADQFVIRPAGRHEDHVRARVAGDEAWTVIAGYHWFTDWGRDTMISLEGLTLTTGRHMEAGWILRTFAYYVKSGLIPNMFPEGENDGLYHTADATLWFFHAIDRYVEATRDTATLRAILPKLVEIVRCHLEGTRFGIGVDREDGLLRQGAPGYQLTWMDAKVDGWVVTPRRGKAVEINALFYNALRILQQYLMEEGDADTALRIGDLADRVRISFNHRFWYEEGRYLYDVVDAEGGGDDAALRPNQIFAVALDHPVLDRERWQPVVDIVERELVTPVGLRSLGRNHPDYKRTYDGDLRARDAAYHQGTVWGWLIGPFIDAWVKVHDDREGALRFLEGFKPHLADACIGTISEVFDAEEPFTPRGCAAQAWSVAEVLRCVKGLRERPKVP
jgi:predicted glycogen debranching enzyme